MVGKQVREGEPMGQQHAQRRRCRHDAQQRSIDAPQPAADGILRFL